MSGERITDYTYLGAKQLAALKKNFKEKRKLNLYRLHEEFQTEIEKRKGWQRIMGIAYESALPGKSRFVISEYDHGIAKQLNTALQVIWENIWDVKSYDTVRTLYNKIIEIPNSENPVSFPSKLGRVLFVLEPDVSREELISLRHNQEKIIKLALNRGAQVKLAIKERNVHYESSIHIGFKSDRLKYGLGHETIVHTRQSDFPDVYTTEPSWYDTPQQLLDLLGKIEQKIYLERK